MKKTIDIVQDLCDIIRRLEQENKRLKTQLNSFMSPVIDFKTLRKDSGLTLREVEEKTGISTAYLSQLETGKIDNPSYKVTRTLWKLYSGQNEIKMEGKPVDYND